MNFRPAAEALEPRTTPSVITPAVLRRHFGLPALGLAGRGQTMAIVDAFDGGAVRQDFAKFCHLYHLPRGVLDVVYTDRDGNPTPTRPPGDIGWGAEERLDTQWARVAAPAARVLLVEAPDSDNASMLAAVRYAAAQPGVVAVGMSWGEDEFEGEQALEPYFVTPAGHAPVTFYASTGDSGTQSWPAESANVIGTGGTQWKVDARGRVTRVSGWRFSGGGPSAFLPDSRGNPDVALPAAGIPIVDTELAVGHIHQNLTVTPAGGGGARPAFTALAVAKHGTPGLVIVAGTSCGPPVAIGLTACLDEALARRGLPPVTLTIADHGAITAADFADVTRGGTAFYAAGPGFDFVTGYGEPVPRRILDDYFAAAGQPAWRGH